MTVSDEDRRALAALDARIRAILPPEYQASYQEVLPVSMGSTGLKYSSDGRVAWDLIWGSFCDLAMAGGPPHKGTLLEPGSATEIAAQPGRYDQVTGEIGRGITMTTGLAARPAPDAGWVRIECSSEAMAAGPPHKGMLLEPGSPAAIAAQPHRYDEVTGEICRGITMTTGLAARPAPDAGWVRIECSSEAMAAWLHRAIVMENVSARGGRRALDLPAAPGFQLHQEIKNVVTVIAKTCHYWTGHISRAQQHEIGELLSGMSADAPLITPAFAAGDPTAFAPMAEAIHQRTGLAVSAARYAGWLGVECADVQSAVWMMRALVVNNILARRQGTTLFVPINAAEDPGGVAVVNCLARICALARAAGLLT